MTLEEFIADCRRLRAERIARERQERQDAEAARIQTVPEPLRPFVAVRGDPLAADLVIRAPGLEEMRVAFNGVIRVGGRTFTDFTEATAFASDPPPVSEVKAGWTLQGGQRG